ncbi:4'-phosphopantetheinyl transferase family protein [Imhoffiella purpurea]|uniref:4'-phosphopantetheinyl transferase n=1 Tax=Imhoffiella purpurea TaxID=1249627 RepID=W9VT22_9GAMM|nr:4'-phosphopantetheinyl transferase superfamily protein [Imhoffiella purpurea]EXJ13525.1 4'-phosphopantetheinyl transferase [Imhoffiella purpurea]
MRDGASPHREAAVLICSCRLPPWAGEEELRRGLSLLPPSLHREIERYRRIEDRLARLTARLLLRAGLGLWGLDADNALAALTRDANGRPSLTGSDLDISISHSNPWVVTGFGRGCRIGLDVEVYRPLDPAIFEPYLAQDERSRIARDENGWMEALRCWSLREAILKADGRGLLAPEAVVRDIHRLCSPSGEPWLTERLDIPDGCLYLACDVRAIPERREWRLQELLIP